MPFTFVKPGEVLASGVCIPLVSLLMVALRIYTRKGQKQVLKADDWLIIPAFVRLIKLNYLGDAAN